MLRLQSVRCRAMMPSIPLHSVRVMSSAGKKDLSESFPAKYSPAIESGWYDWWKARGYFQPNTATCTKSSHGVPKKRFSLVLPPPNVTGVLHLGHALTATVQVQT